MYGYNLFYDGTQITSRDIDEAEYETEEECYEEAENEIDSFIEYWKSEGSWHETDSRDDFYVDIFETDDEIESSQSITASYGGPRIENIYDVKYVLEDLLQALGDMSDMYLDNDSAQKTFGKITSIIKKLQGAYNTVCTMLD